MTKVKSINDYSVGDKENIIHKITEEDVQKFANLTGDYNPLHLDEEFAKTTDFKKPVVFGMLSASFISTLIGMKIPGPGALWTSQTLEFLHQVFVNDILHIEAEVIQISIATNTLVLKIEVKNQHGYIVLKGNANVQILKIEADKEKENADECKVCLITGGTSDIGAAVIEKAISDGYKVVLNYSKSSEKAKYLEDKFKGKGFICIEKADISNENEVKIMIQNIENNVGKITALVHCAAPYNMVKRFNELNWTDVDKQLNVQIKGLYNCLKFILPSMIDNKINGKIIAVGSIAADGIPPAAQYDYVIAKAALSSFIKSLAVEYSPKGIACNIVSPGMTETERIVDLPQKAKLMTKMQNPSRNLIKAEEVAETITFLLSRKSCAITGETIRVCGGIQMI
ncbi:MAG: SDR family oxidoreductase [Lachnospiraceae bacterium]|nr:SDR family oxidoreductase [Lachnospiraceae bacterium]